MTKRSVRKNIKERRLEFQSLEQRRLLAADLMVEFNEAQPSSQDFGMQPTEMFSVATPMEAVQLEELPRGNNDPSMNLAMPMGFAVAGQFPDGLWIQDASRVDANNFGNGTFDLEEFTGEGFPVLDSGFFDMILEIDLEERFDPGYEDGFIEVELSPMEQAQAELELYDADSDGIASREEIGSTYQSEYGLREVASLGAADGLLGRFDANKDGALDVSELVVSYHQELAKVELEWLDRDADGSATEAEIADSYAEAYGLRPAAASGAAEGLLTEYDTNQDGGLNLDELTASNATVTVDVPGTDEVIVDEQMDEVEAVFDSPDAGDEIVVDDAMSKEELAAMLGATADLVEVVDMADGRFYEEASDAGSDGIVLAGDATPEEFAEAMMGITPDDIVFIGDSGEIFADGFEAVEAEMVDVIAGDLTAEELADKLGIPVDSIEFVDFADEESLEGEIDFDGEVGDFTNEVTTDEIAELLGVPVEAIEMMPSDGIVLEAIEFVGEVVELEGQLSPAELADEFGVPVDSIISTEEVIAETDSDVLKEPIEQEMARIANEFANDGFDFWFSPRQALSASTQDMFFAELNEAVEEEEDSYAWSLEDAVLNLSFGLRS